MKSLFFLIVFAEFVFSFYVPGSLPNTYTNGQQIPVKVNKLTSVHTLLPYDHYSLPFCSPTNVINYATNLGEVLVGDRVRNSLYEINGGLDVSCRILCFAEYNQSDIDAFKLRIKDEYKVSVSVDNLPAADTYSLLLPNNVTQDFYSLGYFIGETDDQNNYYLNNHLDFKILIHRTDATKDQNYKIVGVEIDPWTIQHSNDFDPNQLDNDYPETCDDKDNAPSLLLALPFNQTTLKVLWTYSVTFVDSPINWSNRWDKYFKYPDNLSYHWISTVVSLVVVTVGALLLFRAIRRDIQQYALFDGGEGPDENESGWKLVHGDVFRPPSRPLLFAVLVGSGFQILGVLAITLFVAIFGFLSPANRGSFITCIVVLTTMMGFLSGYIATRFYKRFHGQNYKKCFIATSTFFPGVMLGIYFILDMVYVGAHSSGAIPVGTWFALLALWICVSVPLCFFGSYIAFRRPVAEPPVKVNQIPRTIPKQVWYMNPMFSILIGGGLPFGAIFIEYYFTLMLIWGSHFSNFYGFFSVALFVLVLSCAETAIIMIYFQLCNEDYRWWWRSFLTSGVSGIYMFCYSVFYYFAKLHLNYSSSVAIYMIVSLMVAFAFFLVTGTVGFYASFFFVRKIYAQIKID